MGQMAIRRDRRESAIDFLSFLAQKLNVSQFPES